MGILKTKLTASSASFDTLMNGFGVVTVMDAEVYEIPATVLDYYKTGEKTAAQLLIALLQKDTTTGAAKLKKPLCTLKTLKVSNVTMEGPTKTISGGRNNSNLVKYGKTARLEIQDALGSADSLETFCGIVSEWDETQSTGSEPKKAYKSLHVTDRFSGPVAIIGKAPMIDQDTGNQVEVELVFWQVLPDSVFNLTQDASGDATVFDLNGDLLATAVQVPTSKDGNTIVHEFYEIVPDGTAKEDLSAS